MGTLKVAEKKGTQKNVFKNYKEPYNNMTFLHIMNKLYLFGFQPKDNKFVS